MRTRSPLEGPPSPRGKYRWGGRTWRYDYGRVAPLLGLRPDPELAGAIGCSRHTLRNFRRALRVPPYHVLRGFEHLLGKVPDVEVARRAGCKPSTVLAMRKRRRIPRCPRGGRRAADRMLEAYVADLERFFNQ